MPAPSPTLLALALLTGAAATAQASTAACELGVQHIELRPEPTSKVHEVCISPLLVTLLSFDTDIARETVTLEGAERFVKAETGESTLKLVPSEKFLPGERLRLTVRFKDGLAPVSAAFWLVVHPARPEPLVEVSRQKRSVESCQQEMTEKDIQLRQCREENARLHAEEPLPVGLAALLDAGLMERKGVFAKSIAWTVTPPPESPFSLAQAFSYRSSKRVAIEVWLKAKQEAPPWTAARAELVGPGGRAMQVLSLRQREPVRFGGLPQRVLIDAEATQEEAQGTFTLKLRDADGVWSAVLSGVTFP
jgi:uncharacterized protein (TIGR02268 family)